MNNIMFKLLRELRFNVTTQVHGSRVHGSRLESNED